MGRREIVLKVEARPEVGGLPAQLPVGKSLDRGFQGVDGLDPRQELLDVPLVLGSEDFGEDAVDHLDAKQLKRDGLFMFSTLPEA